MVNFFFNDKQLWYITRGLFIPVVCILLSYYLGKMEIKYINNSGIKAVFLGGLISLSVFLISYYFSFFRFTTFNLDEIINKAVLCGVLSAESIIYIGESKHLELQKIILFLFLYFHNLDL